MSQENGYQANGNNFGGSNGGQPPVVGQSQPLNQAGYAQQPNQFAASGQNNSFNQPAYAYQSNNQMAPMNAYQGGYPAQVAARSKSKVVAAVLAFFLGGTGIHNFYLGNVGRGIIQLLMLVVGSLLSIFGIGFLLLAPLGIWVIIEFIMILVGSGNYGRDSRGVPLA
uniref:TM2 domain-containing protein n=1 Tax=Vaginimicrobium propionicum TaxID=1871034 RepID=UPI0009706C31|nr:TM2 domain-containing protein [Vaginimicrobium propionicum]